MVKPGKRPKQEKPGPDPEELQIEGDWEEAMKHALGKERPPEGLPEPGRSAEECPHCHRTVYVSLANYVHLQVVTCQHCDGRSKLAKVPSPTQKDLGITVWALIPLADDSK